MILETSILDYCIMASLTDKYQKKTDREHVLDNPDTYTGSMEQTDIQPMYTTTRQIKSSTNNYPLFLDCLNCLMKVW